MTDAIGHEPGRPTRVLVLWNRLDGGKQPDQGTPDRTGRARHIDAIVDALLAQDCWAQAIDIEDDVNRLRDALIVVRPELVLNLIDHFQGDTTRHASIVALLELLGAAYAGSSAICLASSQDRVRAHVSLAHAGVATSGFCVVRDGNTVPDTDELRPPMIVTQAFDDVYVHEGRKHPLADRAQVLAQCARLLPEYDLPFLIEEYIAVRRLYVLVLGNRVLDVLPIVEATDAEGDSPAWHLAQLGPDTLGRVRDLATRAYRVMECRDFAQIDINLDADDTPHVIDVRPMIDLGEGSPMWAAAGFAGLGPGRVLMTLLGYTRERWGLMREP